MDSVDRTTFFMLEITSISNRRQDKVLKNAEIKVQGAKNKTIDVQKRRATIINILLVSVTSETVYPWF